MSQRFKRLTDLFVRGKAVPLPDGSYLYVRAINSYERDECVSDAQVARSRLIMALKENGSERLKIEALLAREGREKLIADLVDLSSDEKLPEAIGAIQSDPDWTERVAILMRTDPDQAATPPTPDEEALLGKLWGEYYTEIDRRLDDERRTRRQLLDRLGDDDLLEEYLEAWLTKRGSEVANAEYILTEIWYATAYCEAVPGEDGELDHDRCNGHNERVFETKADARSIPDALSELIREVINELTLAGRDPKDSGSATSSSDSSPTPSEAAESTPSTSTATPQTPPGT